MRKAIILAAAGVVLAISAPFASAARPVRLTVGVVAPIGSIDPATGTSDAAREIWNLQYPTLVALSLDTLSPMPGLAEAWSPSADGRGWTYTMRADATWSDGTPITADDVVFSLEHARDEHWPYAKDTLAGLRAAKVDDRTVTVTTTGDEGMLPTLLLHVVPAHVFVAGTDVDGQGIIGSGQWRVTSRTESEVQMAVVDRPGRPALDEIVFRSYPDADALVAAISRGDVDIAAGLPTRVAQRVRDERGVTAIHANDGAQWFLEVRIDDANQRRAISLAIDRERLVASVVDGVGRVAFTPRVMRDTTWGLDDADRDALEPRLAYAPARSRRVLARAGSQSLTLATDQSRGATDIADFIARDLTAAGFDVTPVSGGVGDVRVIRRDPTDDPGPALAPFTCAGNVWCDTEYDAAFTSYKSGGQTEQRAAVRTMVQALAEHSIEIDLFAPDELQAFRTDNVTGMLRAPEQERLVAFWPSVQHYSEIVPAQVKGGQEVPTGVFIAVSLLVVAGVVGGLIVVAQWRSRALHSAR